MRDAEKIVREWAVWQDDQASAAKRRRLASDRRDDLRDEVMAEVRRDLAHEVAEGLRAARQGSLAPPDPRREEAAQLLSAALQLLTAPTPLTVVREAS